MSSEPLFFMTVVQRNALSGRIININKQFNLVYFYSHCSHFNHHYRHLVIMDLTLLVTPSDRTHPLVSLAVSHGSFCILVLMRSTLSSPTHQSSSPSHALPCSHKRDNDDRVTAVYLFYQEWRKCHPTTCLSGG
jgi:hypothetical protein